MILWTCSILDAFCLKWYQFLSHMDPAFMLDWSIFSVHLIGVGSHFLLGKQIIALMGEVIWSMAMPIWVMIWRSFSLLYLPFFSSIVISFLCQKQKNWWRNNAQSIKYKLLKACYEIICTPTMAYRCWVCHLLYFKLWI